MKKQPNFPRMKNISERLENGNDTLDSFVLCVQNDEIIAA